jgi:uncharacterized repeat protein (TIGR04042 family)
MPEVIFTLRWPNGSEEAFYSPSTIVAQYLKPGIAYPMAEFITVARTALQRASGRVEAVYGHPCSRAAATLAGIEARARDFPDAAAAVVCLTITSPHR